DQAKLLRDSIATLARLNPWIGGILDVQAFRVVNTRGGAALDILSSDVATSYGQLPDFVMADELTHWQKEDLWSSLLSAATKRGNFIMVVGMNAGFSESFAFTTREKVRTDPAWHFQVLDGPRASWISPERLEEQQRLLPAVAYDRLWLNRWSMGSGDAISEAD